MYLAAVPRQIISPQNNQSIVGIFQIRFWDVIGLQEKIFCLPHVML